MNLVFKGIAALGLGLLVAGCTLPQSAPTQKQILADVNDEFAGFAFYPVNRSFLPVVQSWPMTGLQYNHQWISRQRGPASSVIAVGDRLSLNIWDPEENSLLTSSDGKVAQITDIDVSSTGSIFVPYLEDIVVSGMTVEQARKDIQTQMETIIPSAQVQITLTPGRQNSADIVSGVKTPGQYPLTDRNTTILSLVAASGGVPETLRNPHVRLVRGDTLYSTSLSRLYSNPSLDTTLRGGDKVIIEEDERFFISLGATGAQQLVYFPNDRITALEAISLTGGIANNIADPKGILILRNYPQNAVQPGTAGPDDVRSIFALDITTADGVFSAGKFQIHSGDIVLATESPIARARTAAGLFAAVVGTVAVANSVSN